MAATTWRDQLRGRRWLWLAGGALLLLPLLLTLWRTVGQPRDRIWERMEETGVWRVAMDPSFPPFETLDAAGRPVGFDVDLAREMAARWGVEAGIESVGFDSLVDAVWASRVDTALSALPYQPQFSQDVAFSQPYFEAGLMLVAASGRDDLNTLEDLAGQRIAVEWGSEGDLQARALRRQSPETVILPLETAQDALQAVVDGDADAALVDRVSALQFPSIAQLRIAPEPVVSDPYVVVMPRKASISQQQVDKTLRALKEDGTLAELEARWFSVTP